MRKRSFLLATVISILGLFLISCGPSGTGKREPSEETTSRQRGGHQLAAKPEQTTSPTTGSPLKRHDTPPEGVRPMLAGFGFGGGEDPCRSGEEAERDPSVYVPGKPEIATEFYICVQGFAANREIQIQVKYPDGRVKRDRISVPGYPTPTRSTLWTSLPGDPLGEYAVIATQGEGQAQHQAMTSFMMSAASKPHIMVLPNMGPPGTTFRFALAGFAPDKMVPLHLYRQDTSCTDAIAYCYVTSLPPANMDSRGEAIYMLRTQPDDPQGSYRVITEPIVNLTPSHAFPQTGVFNLERR
jgi:hypothetical protein